MKLLSAFKRNQKIVSIYIVFLTIAIIFYGFIIKFSFLKAIGHFLDLIRQVAPLAFVSFGQTLVLLVGGIDLSVGAVASLSNILTANFMMGKSELIPITIFLTLLICMMIGFINGLVIVKAKIPPFLVTLAMSSVIRGAYLLYTGGAPKGAIAMEFRSIASKWIGLPIGNLPGIFPVAGVIWIVVFIALAFMLYKTSFGIKIYATGGNVRTAWLSGINTDRIIIAVYVLSSMLAGVSGLMHSALIGVAFLHIGDAYLLDSIAATCIGGTTFEGGRGGLIGTVAGFLTIRFLNSIMTMMGIQEAGKYIAIGLLLIIILSINHFTANTRDNI